MNNSSEINNSRFDFENEIDLKKLFEVIIKGKWILFASIITFSLIALIFSLSLPNIYESRSLLAPTSSNDSSGLMQSYSSLASVAGIDLSPTVSENNAELAFKKINSLSFFEKEILPNIFLPDLMAYKKWNPELNESIYDETQFDESSGEWVREYSYPQKLIPSSQESFYKFRDNHFNISMDKKTNFVTIAVKHQSPHIAKEWTTLLVDQINNFYRKKDKDEAERAYNYLNNQIAGTNLSEIKQVIAILLQQETQKLTLIEVNDYYVFEYIDPPAVMEKKSDPNRLLICIIGLIFGFFSGATLILLRYFLSNEEINY
jgi:LPS O-antigen subunit length determinant protein (WzzB/FepE family)